LGTKIKLMYVQRSIPKTAKSKRTLTRALALHELLSSLWFCYQQQKLAIKENLFIFLTLKGDQTQETIKAD